MSQMIKQNWLAFGLALQMLFTSFCYAHAEMYNSKKLKITNQSSKNDFSPILWKTVKDKQGSSVDVPISLVTEMENNAVLVFQSDNGLEKIQFSTTIENRPGFPGNNPEGDMNLRRSDCDSWPPAYLVLKTNIASYSCIKRNSVRYYVAKYNKSGDTSLYIEYPIKYRKLWAKVVSRMVESLRQTRRRGQNH